MKALVYAHDLVADFERRLAEYRSAAKGPARKLLERLALSLVKRADERFLLDHPPELLLPELEELLAAIDQRAEGEVLVTVAAGQAPAGTAPPLLVSTCMADQPFIVDTLRLCFQRLELEVVHQLTAIVPVARSQAGQLRDIGSDAAGGPTPESITLFVLPPVPQRERQERVRAELTDKLILARAVVLDFRRMIRQVKDAINQLDLLASLRPEHQDAIAEARAFLDWLVEDNFVLMGMTELAAGGDDADDGRLGTHRFRARKAVRGAHEVQEFLAAAPDAQPYVAVHKTLEESVVHRHGKIDAVAIRRFDDRGRAVGCLVLHGLFTYRALQARGSGIPILRRKLQQLVEAEDLVPGSYNYKSVVNSFDSLPVEYLFAAPVEDIQQLVGRALAAERSRRLEIHLSLNADERAAYVFVVLPKERFNDALRVQLQQFLEQRLHANYADHRVLISNFGVAVLHYFLTSDAAFPAVDDAELEKALADLASSWQDRFRDALLAELPRETALSLYRTYQSAFSTRYQVSTSPRQAVRDCQRLERVRHQDVMEFDLYLDAEDQEQGTVKLRLYERRNLMLSDVLPILDDFGLQVMNSFVNHVEFPGGGVAYMDTFRFLNRDGQAIDLPAQRDDFLQALAAVFEGLMPSDRLNRVLLPARLSWRQVDLLRSYQGYSKQLGSMFTPGTVWATLVRHADVVRLLVECFHAKFGPDAAGQLVSSPDPAREARSGRLRAQADAAIDRIEDFNDDRILRTFANLIDATLRTSVYQERRGAYCISHKLDCARVASMSKPRPWREIYVHSPQVEGVHLRGGRIARGGLRWSDRPDDYRTEVLGLMTTQMVKNVVIVPLGAKGGFVLKRPPAEAAARRAHADAMYRVFVGALLDLTDDVQGTRTIPPPQVVCYDDPDPYLVVAADKGTAHLSDTANALSQERGFWLGDAFASGGSVGYDHKAMGITARGAWVCIRHLFREAGIDVAQPFTVVGIGDMGGDVFGNGLIEHPTIKLIAAFNHQHIFLDPDPDPAASHRERTRLFQAGYGGWDAYDKACISKGGGVFDRSAKSIPLSPPVRKLLGTERTALPPSELIRELLQLPVDLLYNGGIGTYVKASQEGNVEARDPSNDALRIDAPQLRARVVGEGGNLGLTQAARVEYARRGGRLNTDFVDNAGGVNTSDHEVNLKILLQPQVAAGELTASARAKLLREVQPQVAEDVLEANASQALMLSLDELRSRQDLAPFQRLIEEVCRRFALERSELGLPTVREIEHRMLAHEGLTRPELATLCSYVKMMIYADLVDDTRVELEGLRPYLHNYFPAKVRARFGEAIDRHRLGREIALTRLTNRIVDHTGASFFDTMAAEADAAPKPAVEAYSLLSRAAETWALKDEILDAPGVPVAVQYEAMLTVEAALRNGALHLLAHWPAQRLEQTLRDSSVYGRKLKALASGFLDLLDPVGAQAARQESAALAARGLPDELAVRLTALRHLPFGLVALDLAERSGRPAKPLARDYFVLGRASGILGTVERLERRQASASYEAMALRALRRELLAVLADVVVRLASVAGTPEERLASLGRGGQALLELHRIGDDQLGPAALVVTLDRVRSGLRATS